MDVGRKWAYPADCMTFQSFIECESQGQGTSVFWSKRRIRGDAPDLDSKVGNFCGLSNTAHSSMNAKP
jgi:hypothetical protein